MFVAYECGLEVVRQVSGLVSALERRDSDLASQLRRAATSVVLNIAEGNGRSGKERIRFFRFAQGSAREVVAAIELAEAWSYVDRASTQELLDKATRVVRLLCGLTR